MANHATAIDRNGFSVPVIELFGTPSNGTIAGTTARVTLPAGVDGGDIVRVCATSDCYVLFGTSAVNAATTDFVFPAGVEHFKVPDSATHVAFIQVTAGGIFSVSRVR